MKKKILLLITLLALFLLTCTQKNNADKTKVEQKIINCESFYAQKKYTKAMPHCEREAKQGNVKSQYLLSLLYFEKVGIAQASDDDKSYFDYKNNLEKAVYWLDQSAKNGYVNAQKELGDLYIFPDAEYSEYIKHTDSEYILNTKKFWDDSLHNPGRTRVLMGAYWYRKAAEQGYAEGQYKLCDYYDGGAVYYLKPEEFWSSGKDFVISPKYKEAIYWRTQSAEQGYSDAQVTLGEIYLNLEENTDEKYRDYKKGLYWLNKAAQQNNRGAYYDLWKVYSNGTKEIPKDQEKAKYWFNKYDKYKEYEE